MALGIYKIKNMILKFSRGSIVMNIADKVKPVSEINPPGPGRQKATTSPASPAKRQTTVAKPSQSVGIRMPVL